MAEEQSSPKQQQEDASARSKTLIESLKKDCGSQIIREEISLGDAVVEIAPKDITTFFTTLKETFGFNSFVSVTAIDHMDHEFLERKNDERFELVYHLLNLSTLARLRVKVGVPEEKPEVATVSTLWHGANFMEREVYDMYGIRFSGHSDLRRILMYDEFDGYPLRKDYPIQGKQPRIPLRAAEVENTARHMNRPSLISINPRRESTSSH